MKVPFICYIILINILGFSLMGADKRKAVKNQWRISEKTLFIVALLGGSIGSFLGMYLFRHKTKKLRFSIGIPSILVLQILLLVFLLMYEREKAESPSAAVERELALIQNLDAETIRSFISYERILNTPSPAEVGSETTEAVNLFFKNFQYQIYSETITGDTALVTAKIINIDTRELAADLCRTLTAQNLSISPIQDTPETLNDYYALLKDTLENHSYGLAVSTADFHLKKSHRSWIIQADETLQDQLVSGFISWMNDPTLLSPQEVLAIYLDGFRSLSPEEWIEYLKIQDIFSTNSEAYSASIDQVYAEKIAEYFSYTIDGCTVSGDTAAADLTISSIDMPQALASYKERLLSYAHTTESITSDEAALTDATARYLLETLKEDARPADISVTITLTNDGHTWQPEVSDELTNAFLGNITGALESFQGR